MINYILIGVITVCLIALGIIFVFIQKNQRKNRAMRIVKTNKSHSYLVFLKKFFLTMPVLRKYFEKVRRRMEVIYPADVVSISMKTTQVMLFSTGIAASCGLFVLLIAGGDLFYVCAGLFMVGILFKTMTDGKLESMEKKILLQFNDFLSDLPSYYREANGILEDAIYAMLDRLPYEISLHISRIYEILVDPHLNEKVEEYIDSAPNKYILTFVSLCATTKEYGDKELPDGSTSFLDGLINLRKEINVEILRRINVDMQFQSLTVIAVAPVVALKFVEWWGTNMFEGISGYYTGTYGTLVVMLTFLASYISYTMILSLRNTKRGAIRENSAWMRISNIPVISAFLNQYISKNYTKMVRLDDDMRITGDHTGPKAFLVKQAVCAIAAFLVVNMLFIAADIQGKSNTLKNVAEDFSDTIVPNEYYTKAMNDMAEWSIMRHKGEIPDREVIKKELQENDNVLRNDEYLDIVTDAVIKRLQNYKNYYFRWYYILIAATVAVAGFYAPYMLLKFKTGVVHISQEDEVNQFNTLMLIFMNMDGISIDTILEWIERFAYCFKQEISECIIEYESGQQKALEKLRDEAKFAPFQKFVNCLINIDEVGIREAFDDVKVQQNYYNEKRQLDNARMTASKAKKAAALAFIPMGIVIVGYLIVPIAALGIKMSSGLTETFGTV